METVHFLAKLTEQGRLRWQKDGPDTYSSSAANEKFVVEFLYYMPTDGCAADRSAVRLSGLVLSDFAVGTEGFDLICMMLATSEPELKRWRTMCETQWLERFSAFKSRLRKGRKHPQRKGRSKAR